MWRLPTVENVLKPGLLFSFKTDEIYYIVDKVPGIPRDYFMVVKHGYTQ